MNSSEQNRTQHQSTSGNQGKFQQQQQSSSGNRGIDPKAPDEQHEIATEGARAAHEPSYEEAREVGKHSHDNSHAGDDSKSRDGTGTHTHSGSSQQHAEADRQSDKGDAGNASEKH